MREIDINGKRFAKWSKLFIKTLELKEKLIAARDDEYKVEQEYNRSNDELHKAQLEVQAECRGDYDD